MTFPPKEVKPPKKTSQPYKRHQGGSKAAAPRHQTPRKQQQCAQ
eukprot:CAMPEP_0194735398 /NCGR_PEP_ID=MMETSP0296-20130528/73327_1 /TAXON_ID=39354 /ORGANISM="Heterosigma akashiwo, Strain CCMP2393" /LENGTH=43 /DNA_ID= /DNA_START= /DNA_END= /DNA_ORIENTATION=